MKIETQSNLFVISLIHFLHRINEDMFNTLTTPYFRFDNKITLLDNVVSITILQPLHASVEYSSLQW